jgi:crossover junction endodeoxyribonuclease RusA
LIGVKQDAKSLAMFLTRESRLVLLETDLQIKITFCPPDKRRRDLDNLYATFKPYQDGIFEALGLDDCLIDRVILQRGELVKDGCVVVELKEA